MSEQLFVKDRIHWVDSAKAILIVLVAMVHMIQRGWELGISCSAIEAMSPITSALCFRMPAFFLLAGFWGRYDVGFKDFVIKSAKGLLLPLIIFSYLGGILHEVFYEMLKKTYNAGALEGPSITISLDYWFVLALFIARCIYWGVCRLSKKQGARIAICFGLYFLGIFTLKLWFLPNYACWKWSLIMLVYLPLGSFVRENLNNWKLFVLSLVVYAVGLVFYWNKGGIPIPGVNMVHINFLSAVPSLVLCTAGSLVFLKLCSYIKKAKVLEMIGRNTLAIYIMHWWVEILAMKVLRDVFSQGIWVSTLAILVVLAAAVFVPCLISELLNRPKVKWIIGK